jgi:hypothetical protein
MLFDRTIFTPLNSQVFCGQSSHQKPIHHPIIMGQTEHFPKINLSFLKPAA